MQYTEKKQYRGMGEYLFRKWMDDEIEPDDWFRDDIGHEAFARFGKRVILDIEGEPIEHTKHASFEDAFAHMDELHTHRAPTGFDAIVAEDHRGYFVSIEMTSLGHFGDRDEAMIALAREMVRFGCFPDAFYVNDRGNYHRIDNEIRAYHDEGGDKMLPQYQEV